jgi:NitT/TauT family transport system permease protein
MTGATDISTLAVPVLRVEAPKLLPVQDTGFDVAALLTVGLIIVLFHVLSPALRDDSQTGQAFSAMSLRQLITVVFGFLTIALAAGENNKSERMKAFSLPAIRWLVKGIVGFYLAYALVLLISLLGVFSVALPIFALASTLISVIVYVLILGATINANEGNAAPPGPTSVARSVRWLASALLGVYTLYVISFVFFGLDIVTDTMLPTGLELAALVSVVVLWQPWNRLPLYQQQMGKVLPPVLIFVGVLVIWELIVKTFNIQQFLLPAPSVIIDTFTSIYPRLVNQGWLTFQNALWGFGIGCSAGIVFGLASARFAGFSKAVLPYAIAVNSIPIIAFAPITNAWFGVVNPTSKILIVAILTFFPTMINTVRGLTAVDAASLELMRSLAASEFDIFRKVRLPVALPFIFNGLKISTSLSMIGAIVAEYFGGPTTGLGVQISSNAQLIRFPLVWSQIIIASALGIIFYFVVSLSERLIMPWHVAFRPRAD